VRAASHIGPLPWTEVDRACTPAARDCRLFRRYRDETDPVDREELVHRFLPLARRLATRYAGGTEPFDDLLQVACMALVRAIDRFDPSRNVAFSTYAVPTICGELKRHYRDKTWAVRVPRDLQDLAGAVAAERERLIVQLGHLPTARELSEHFGISEEAVVDAVCAGEAYEATSLEAPRGGDDLDLTLGDSLPYYEGGYDLADTRVSLDRLLRTLSRRDREILRLRFEEDLTQREIGRRLGVSQMHVSRLLRAAIDELGETAETLTAGRAPAEAGW
jgi:RNA polymerase sigma-B factor